MWSIFVKNNVPVWFTSSVTKFNEFSDIFLNNLAIKFNKHMFKYMVKSVILWFYCNCFCKRFEKKIIFLRPRIFHLIPRGFLIFIDSYFSECKSYIAGLFKNIFYVINSCSWFYFSAFYQCWCLLVCTILQHDLIV